MGAQGIVKLSERPLGRDLTSLRPIGEFLESSPKGSFPSRQHLKPCFLGSRLPFCRFCRFRSQLAQQDTAQKTADGCRDEEVVFRQPDESSPVSSR